MSENPPASQMIRVPTPLVDAVRELSRLHRLGYTHAVLNGLQQVVSSIDNKADGVGATDRKSDTELIAELIARVETLESAIGGVQHLGAESEPRTEELEELETLEPSPITTDIPDLQDIRLRILKSLKAGEQSVLYKRVKAELDQLLPPSST